MKKCCVYLFLIFTPSLASAEEYLGRLSTNPYAPSYTSGVSANNFGIKHKQAMENEYATGDLNSKNPYGTGWSMIDD
jgi:hypothetical protein